MKDEVSKLNEQRVQELERISGLTSEQAKDYLLKIVEDEVKHESAVMIKEMTFFAANNPLDKAITEDAHNARHSNVATNFKIVVFFIRCLSFLNTIR